jgi:hypothetical protein
MTRPPLPELTARWFPLLPRARPVCRALYLRIDEVRELAAAACSGPPERRLSSAAEAHNKAALIASDCGLADLAWQLCWRQFDTFSAAMPLTPQAARLALQPLINLGRLLTRNGNHDSAYQHYLGLHDAAVTRTRQAIAGRTIDLSHLVTEPEARHEIRRHLWTVLLADGTRALTAAGRWPQALTHLQQHKGIGTRLLDGRQVAIVAACHAGESDHAFALAVTSATSEPWEHAIRSYFSALSVAMNGSPAESHLAAAAESHDQIAAMPGSQLFSTRLGLCVLELAQDRLRAGRKAFADRIIDDAIGSADAYAARDILAQAGRYLSVSQGTRKALSAIVDSSGLGHGDIPADAINGLLEAATASEYQIGVVLGARII